MSAPIIGGVRGGRAGAAGRSGGGGGARTLATGHGTGCIFRWVRPGELMKIGAPTKNGLQKMKN